MRMRDLSVLKRLEVSRLLSFSIVLAACIIAAAGVVAAKLFESGVRQDDFDELAAKVRENTSAAGDNARNLDRLERAFRRPEWIVSGIPAESDPAEE